MATRATPRLKLLELPLSALIAGGKGVVRQALDPSWLLR